VAEQRAGDAQQRVFHVELFGRGRCRLGAARRSGGHAIHDTAMKARPSLRCVERMWRARRDGREWSRPFAVASGGQKHVTDFGRAGRIWWLYGEVDGASVLSAAVTGVRRSPGAARSGASIVWRR